MLEGKNNLWSYSLAKWNSLEELKAMVWHGLELYFVRAIRLGCGTEFWEQVRAEAEGQMRNFDRVQEEEVVPWVPKVAVGQKADGNGDEYSRKGRERMIGWHLIY